LFLIYLFALLLSSFSQNVLKTFQNSTYFLVVTVLIGLLFILFGLQKSLKFKINLKPLAKVYNFFFRKSLKMNSGGGKSFAVGMTSIALPCSALYLFTFTLSVAGWI
jgi:uncharacterized protein YacL